MLPSLRMTLVTAYGPLAQGEAATGSCVACFTRDAEWRLSPRTVP